MCRWYAERDCKRWCAVEKLQKTKEEGRWEVVNVVKTNEAETMVSTVRYAMEPDCVIERIDIHLRTRTQLPAQNAKRLSRQRHISRRGIVRQADACSNLLRSIPMSLVLTREDLA